MDWKNLTYKKKCILLAAGFFVFLLIAWNMSFSKTLSLKSQCGLVEEKLAIASTSESKITTLSTRNAELDRIIGRNMGSEHGRQEKLLEKVSLFCKENGLILREFPEAHQYQSHDYLVSTNFVHVEGVFTKLLKLVYLTEQSFNLGQLISLRFYSKKDLKSKMTKLFLVMYLQNIKKNNTDYGI